MTSSTPAEILAATGPVFLDFDGPVTHLFIEGRNRAIADQMRAVLRQRGEHAEDQAATTNDPLVVLRWTYTNRSPVTFAEVEEACIAGEVAAVAVTEPTPCAHPFIRACHTAGRPLIILSNNAPQAIAAYLDRFELTGDIGAVVARVPGNPELMKPHRHLVDKALALVDVPPSEVAFIGDSVTDIEVGLATGLRTIGFAKNSARGQELDDAGAESIAPAMQDLADILTGHRSLVLDQ